MIKYTWHNILQWELWYEGALRQEGAERHFPGDVSTVGDFGVDDCSCIAKSDVRIHVEV